MKSKINLIRCWATLSCGLILALVLFLFGYVLYYGAGAISWEFLTQSPQGVILGTEGGILPAIIGSLYYTLIAAAMASVLGISTSIYLVFYCRSRRAMEVVSLMMQCMAGVPSIVMGLFGYSFLVLMLGWGKCLLAGGITQGFLILPVVQIRTEKALREVDPQLIAASCALGVTPSWTIRRIVLPHCLPELTSAVILGACHAMGAAAPLIFTGAVILSKVPTDLMKPAMALPYHLYMLLTQGTSTENAYATAFVMMVLVLLSNTAVTWLAWRKRK